MPIYTFKCPQCERITDVFRKIEDRFNAPACHGPMKRIYNYSVIGDLKPYVDDMMTDKPIYVKSKKHREQLMKQNGIYEKYGKGWL